MKQWEKELKDIIAAVWQYYDSDIVGPEMLNPSQAHIRIKKLIEKYFVEK